MNKKRYFLIMIVFMVITNLIVWGYLLLKKQKVNSSYYWDLNGVFFTKKIELPNFNLKNLDGDLVTLDYFDARLNILIFFSLKDCSSCLYEAEYWGEASRTYSKSDVILSGITNETDRSALNEFSDEYRFSFPIILDKNSGLKDKIVQISKDSRLNIFTPFKVFVNRDHEIIYVEGPVKDVNSQKLFTDRVSKLLSNYKAGDGN